jgi:hypothetical protein
MLLHNQFFNFLVEEKLRLHVAELISGMINVTCINLYKFRNTSFFRIFFMSYNLFFKLFFGAFLFSRTIYTSGFQPFWVHGSFWFWNQIIGSHTNNDNNKNIPIVKNCIICLYYGGGSFNNNQRRPWEPRRTGWKLLIYTIMS